VGRLSLDQLYDLLDGLFYAQRNQTMHMVDVTVNAIQKDSLFFGVEPNVPDELASDFICQIRSPILCRPLSTIRTVGPKPNSYLNPLPTS
jgi:hypothetical protein